MEHICRHIFMGLYLVFGALVTMIKWCALQCQFNIITSPIITGPDYYHLSKIYLQTPIIQRLLSLLLEIFLPEAHKSKHIKVSIFLC